MKNLLLFSLISIFSGCSTGAVVSAPFDAIGLVGHVLGDVSEGIGDVIEASIDDDD